MAKDPTSLVKKNRRNKSPNAKRTGQTREKLAKAKKRRSRMEIIAYALGIAAFVTACIAALFGGIHYRDSFIWTTCLAILLGVIGGFCWLQDREWKKDAAANTPKDRAKENASFEQRAWITATEVQSDVLEGQNFKVRVTFKNSGRTVATNVGVKLVIQMMPSSAVPEFNDEDVEIKSVGILSPDGICYGNQTAPIVLTREHVESIRLGATSVYINGRVVYTDVFKRPHWTTFCFKLHADGKDPGGVTYAAYGTRYNRTDDNP